MKKLSVFLCAMVLVFGVVGNANSALIDRGGGLIYDEEQDITWLQDTNYAETSDHDSDGLMNWYDAMAWADDLIYYDSVRDEYWDDWRLPTTLGTQEGPINEGEMSHLYYDENITGSSPSPFLNLEGRDYWTSTPQAGHPDMAWNFNFDNGHQNNSNQNLSPLRVIIVMDGDVGAVPIPSAIWLLGSAFIGLVGFRKCRKG